MDLLHGDNLPLMRRMPSASADLIYLDPPFGNAKVWTGTAGVFDDMPLDDLLKFLRPRLVEMHRLLKPTGSIYLHCDDTASHYLKVMLDSIFGIGNFRNEIIWKRMTGKSVGNTYPRLSDMILYYSKTSTCVFNKLYTEYDPEYIRKTYARSDEHGRYASMPLIYKGTDTRYRLPQELPAWFVKPDDWDEMDRDDRWDALVEAGIIIIKPGKNPRYKKYLSTCKGVRVSNLWTDISLIQGKSKENCGYPTQKPIALLERIIRTSSNEGDVVLDPFCGSGTTLVAAKGLGREWIGIDASEDAINIARRRIKD